MIYSIVVRITRNTKPNHPWIKKNQRFFESWKRLGGIFCDHQVAPYVPEKSSTVSGDGPPSVETTSAFHSTETTNSASMFFSTFSLGSEAVEADASAAKHVPPAPDVDVSWLDFEWLDAL